MDGNYVGQIIMTGFNFATSGFVLCQGQTLPISTYQALYSLIGTTYGGDGVNTFGVPDLRGRMPVGIGKGAGLSQVVLGQIGGASSVTLNANNLPAHNHSVPAPSNNVPVNTGAGTVATAAGNYFAAAPAASPAYIASSPSINTYLAATGSTQSTVNGASVPINNQCMSLGINFQIATQGIYPPRN